MTPHISALIENIRALEAELDAELAKRRAELRIGLEHGRVAFEAELLRRHRELRTKLLPYVLGANPLVVLTAPLIYAGIVPFLLLDLFDSVFQAVCFPIYGIAKVKRADYLVFDRHHLARGAHRAILVPDQARAPRDRHACPLRAVRRLRRRRALSGAAHRAA